MVPKKATKLDHKILAEGEATGHKHALIGDGALYRLGSEIILDLPSPAEIHHDEHQPQELPEGTYDRIIVKEFDHAEESARKVVD